MLTCHARLHTPQKCWEWCGIAMPALNKSKTKSQQQLKVSPVQFVRRLNLLISPRILKLLLWLMSPPVIKLLRNGWRCVS
mmetsp:Transcript_63565/g.105711  ORF Transcript_63565/g.105711 Transcript_63565/m.105711 type:complete len:80 (-) Transcript_63565:473-712(-)